MSNLPRYLPVYSDLPPSKEEMEQLRRIQAQRKAGLIRPEPMSSFLDRPAAKQMDFGRRSNYEHDLNVLRHMNAVMTDKAYASNWYERVRKPQPLSAIMGAIYGVLGGASAGYAATGNALGTTGGAALGGAAGTLAGFGRMEANRRIMKGAYSGLVPEAGKQPQAVTDMARLYNKVTGIAVPAAAALAGLAALGRYGVGTLNRGLDT